MKLFVCISQIFSIIIFPFFTMLFYFYLIKYLFLIILYSYYGNKSVNAQSAELSKLVICHRPNVILVQMSIGWPNVHLP